MIVVRLSHLKMLIQEKSRFPLFFNFDILVGGMYLNNDEASLCELGVTYDSFIWVRCAGLLGGGGGCASV